MWRWFKQKGFGAFQGQPTAPVCDYCAAQTDIFAKPTGIRPRATITWKKAPPPGAKDLNFTWTEERETGVDRPWQARCPSCDSMFTWIPPHDYCKNEERGDEWDRSPGEWKRGIFYFEIGRKTPHIRPKTFANKNIYHHYPELELIPCDNCGSMHVRFKVRGCVRARCACGHYLRVW
jgi:hypothetical protein